jgi:glycine betaine/choline ABC-type transport system substrate-binding protein
MRRLGVALIALLIAGCGAETAEPSVAVGTADDAESALLGQLYAASLRYYGSPAHVETGSDPVTDLDTGDVLVVPGLTGRLLARFDPGATARAPEQVYRTMIAALPEGIGAGDYTQSASDEPAVAITETTKRGWGGGSDVTALVRNCDGLSVGALKGAVTPRAVGSCTLGSPREFRDAAALFAALRSGGVDVAWTSTAAPVVPDDVVVLTDRTALIRAENVVPLYRRNALTEQQVLALNQIAGELDTGSLADMLRKIGEGADPGAVAAEWLASHPLGH